MVAVTTTAADVFNTGNHPTSVVIHADSGNSDVIRISGVNPNVTDNYEELVAGASITFFGLQDQSIWAIAVSGTQTLHFPFVQKGGGLVVTK